MKRIFSIKQLLFTAHFALLAGAACADELKINGFAAQGIIQAKDSNFVNNDGSVSAELTEIGLNASYRLNSKLRLSGQAVYLNGGNRFPNGLRVDNLFVDWQVYTSLDTQFNILAGRFKSYHRLHSATRDVPHTRPSIVLPQSLYIDVFRDISIGVDGILLKSNHSNSLGEWDLHWNHGGANISGDQTDLFISPLATGKLKLDQENQGSFLWRPPLSNVQFGGSYVNAKFDYRQGQGDIYFDGTSQIKGYYLNYRYNSELWTFTTEMSRVRTITSGVLFPEFFSDSTGEGIYFEGQYFFTPSLTGTLRLDLYDRNRLDRDGSQLEASTGIPSYFGYMDMAMVGLSWDFAENWRVQGEIHRVKGTGRLAPITIPDLENNDSKYWNIWALQVMYWF